MGKKTQKKIQRRIERGISGFFIFVISLSLLVALISFHSGNLSLSPQSHDDSTRDIFRTYNAVVSHYMFETIGYTSFAVVLFLITLGIVIFLNKKLLILVKPAIFLAIAGLFVPLLITLTVGFGGDNTGIEPAMQYGGILGSLLIHYMVTNFGKVGTYLFSLGAVLISLVLTTNIRPSAVVDMFLSGVKALSTLLPESERTSLESNTAEKPQTAPETTEESKRSDLADNISLLTPQEKDAISKAFELDDEDSQNGEIPSP